jgi:ABC-type multidrug transport system fused ATPase/permease subunit
MKKFKKIYYLFDQIEKRQFILLLFLIFFTSLIDSLGIVSIFPFITLIMNPNIIENNIFLSNFYQASFIIGVSNVDQFIFFLGAIIFITLILSAVIRAAGHYFQIRFAMMREYSIGKTLLENYLGQSYTWFLNNNSVDLSKNILSEVRKVIHHTIIPLINFIASLTTVIILIILLFFVDAVLTFLVGLILLGAYGIIYYFSKNFLHHLGKQSTKSNVIRFDTIAEAFSSIKEIKFLAAEKNYIDRFKEYGKIYARTESAASTISILPRYLIEGLSFSLVILIFLFYIGTSKKVDTFVPTLALYAFASYRLLPALQNSFYAITHIKWSEASFDKIYYDLKNLKQKDNINYKNNISFNKSIILNNVSFKYPDVKYNSIENIDITIPFLGNVGIIGKTGSGKTTIADIILGLLAPENGTLRVDGVLINHKNKQSWKKNIGYVPQQIYLADTSVATNIAFGVKINDINQKAIEKASKLVGIHDFIMKELPNNYQTSIGERGVRLSGGQRQRIGIARALYHQPKLLILDEATNALDNFTLNSIFDSINNLKKNITIITITHQLNAVKNCDIIYFLENGKLKFKGKFEEVARLAKLK